MKKSFFRPVLAFAGIVFLCGILFGIAGSLMGGNPFRASANIERLTGDSIINFEFHAAEPQVTPSPFDNGYYYGDSYDIFSDPDIYEFFEEFGMGDDFFSPYGGGYAPGTDSGKIY